MSTYHGPKRRATDAWWGRIHENRGVVGYVFLVLLLCGILWNEHRREDAIRGRLISERKASIRTLCEADNRDRRILRGIITQATEPEPGASPAEVERELRFRAFALGELPDLDCMAVTDGPSR